MYKNVIILAAGKGTRMHTDLPKCAYPFCGKPMVSYIVDSCKESNVDEIIVVVGYKKEVLLEVLDPCCKIAVQKEQLGTGHAVMAAEEAVTNNSGITLIFPGDMPLIDSESINKLVNKHLEDKNALTVVTTIVEDAAKYGRIYRENGHIKKIIEYKDCNPEQLLINEINSGLFCVDTKLLFEGLKKIKNINAQNEYYLTDLVEILGKDYKVDSYVIEDDFILTGINDLDSLEKAEQIYLDRKNK